MAIKIETIEVKCNDTEDWTGADDLYYIHFLKCSPGARATIYHEANAPSPIPLTGQARSLRTNYSRALHINDGETLNFNDSLLFDSSQSPEACSSERACVHGGIYFFDIDSVTDTKVPVITAGVVGAMIIGLGIVVAASNGLLPGLGVIIGGMAIAAAMGALALLLNIDFDEDDFLGSYYINLPVDGPASEEFTISLGGSRRGIRSDRSTNGKIKTWSKSWGSCDYKIKIQVTRT